MKIDASAIIYIIKANLIDVLLPNYTPLRITKPVFNEVVTKGKLKGYSDAFIIEHLVNNNKIEVMPEIEFELPLLASLGSGEQSSIVEAHQQHELLIIDDKKARNRAIAFNIEFIGTDGLLLTVFLSNYISFDVFKEKLTKLSEIMLLSPTKVIKLLEIAKKEVKTLGDK
ncbi:MAG: hypothetical protein ACXADY_06190 [Candidatus Hodarchaeales archaeon]|jgi:predicted nucleic acid-binding protein